MGLGLTSAVRSAEGSSAVVNFVYLPMAIISGTFFTPKEFPPFLRAIADVLPLTYFTKLTRDMMVRDHHVWSEGRLGRRRAALGRDRPRRGAFAASAGSRASARVARSTASSMRVRLPLGDRVEARARPGGRAARDSSSSACQS